MTKTLPDFLIIGAMKSATSSLYDQLVRQPGIFMSTPKEPNYFSDDDIYANGIEWYENLFSNAQSGDLIGEASTHYTKLPTYPHTVTRLSKHLENPRFIYIMRHPIDRLISHYIHEWSQGIYDCTIDRAIDKYSELISYSLYSMQLQVYFDIFGRHSVLPVFFDRLKQFPDIEFSRICKFIGYNGSPKWHKDLSPKNVSSDRVRRFPLYSLLVESDTATWFRRNFIPKSVRNSIRSQFTLKKRPVINSNNINKLQVIFDEDLSILGGWLGVELNCKNYKNATVEVLDWV